MDYITCMIFFIIIYIFSIFLLIIAWLLYGLCVLFNFKDVLFFVFPKFIQKPLWNIPQGIVTNAKPVFVCITIFLVIMYLAWLIIQLLVPEFILGIIPIRKILSDIRPFPDLNNAGIRTDAIIGKDIVMNGDTYIYNGNLYLTGDIHKGTFNAVSGAWTEQKN